MGLIGVYVTTSKCVSVAVRRSHGLAAGGFRLRSPGALGRVGSTARTACQPDAVRPASGTSPRGPHLKCHRILPKPSRSSPIATSISGDRSKRPRAASVQFRTFPTSPALASKAIWLFSA